MIRLAHVIETFEADFLAQYRHRLTLEHLRALAAIRQCRSQASRRIQVQCTQCDHQGLVPHSCGHRHCPHCQHHESQQWLERQLQKQVPATYFLLTFTLPAQFRALAWAHPDVLYDLLFGCAWQSVHTFSRNDRQLQGTPGAIAVLHTHTRRLDYHPHVHLLMPAAAVDGHERRWRTKRKQRGQGRVIRRTILACPWSRKSFIIQFRGGSGPPLDAYLVIGQNDEAASQSDSSPATAASFLRSSLAPGSRRRTRSRPGWVPG